MRVKSDFEQLYNSMDDPWNIGDADSERYDLYHDMVRAAAAKRGSILDVGSGMGAFLARFRDEFEHLTGVEVSSAAVERGRERFPFIDFVRGSADSLDTALPADARFDAIVYSDVIYYLPEEQKRASLRWIAQHLEEGGLAFIAAYAPGGDYLDHAELRRLVERDFAIEDERVLESRHVALVCRRKRRLVALTLDYETWQPIPEGRRIDWDADVFEPTARLLDALDAEGATLTVMAEMGEYLWLRENDPPVAERMAEQWRDAVRRGHEVQLHLHPVWLPELGARREGERWIWDERLARAADYPGDLTELIGRCKAAIEEAVRPVDPSYRVTCFRAGAYEAQPFARLNEALVANGIACDSSVLPGDTRPDRGYDYRLAYSEHQPYFPSRYDPQLKGPPAERELVELPVFTPRPGQRWTFDTEEGERFAQRLLEHRHGVERLPSTEARRRRRRLRNALEYAYWRLRGQRRLVNRVLPRRVANLVTRYGPERLVQHDYYVLVGHSKTDLRIDAIRAGVRRLRDEGFELIGLGGMAEQARAELETGMPAGPLEEAERQVAREYDAVMADDHNTVQSDVLQRMIPLDRTRVLDAGCGSGAWSERIARLHPWMEVVGVDVGEDFVAKARRDHASERVSFQVEDFAAMSFADEEFDCVYADNTLEHAFDVDATLAELHRLLRDGGALVAAIPADARGRGLVCDNHTWKTAPHEVRLRLEAAGFEDVSIRELDTYRELGMSPFPPAEDRMMYIRAWKAAPGPRGRAEELTRWAYEALDPDPPQSSEDPLAILAGGHAWCWGYVLALGEALRREGFAFRYVTMIAHDHPRGSGPEGRDSHEVIEVDLPDGETVVCDPMAGVVFACSVADLLRDPGRADGHGRDDERWRERGYVLYASSEWYRRVVEAAFRERPNARPRFRERASLAA